MKNNNNGYSFASLIIIANAVNLVWCSYQMISSVLALYVEGMGKDTLWTGIITGAFSIAALFFRPFMGRIVDRYSIKKLLFTVNLLIMAAILIYASVPVIWVMIVFRAVHGICIGIMLTASLVAAERYIEPSKLGWGLSIYGIITTLSFSMGPVMGIRAAAWFGLRGCMYASVVVMLVTTVLCLLIAEPQRQSIDKDKKEDAKGKAAAKLFDLSLMDVVGCYAAFCFVNGATTAFLVIYAVSRGITDVSIYYAGYAVMMLLAKAVLAKILDKVRIEQVIIPAAVMVCAGIIILASAKTLPGFFIAGLLISFAEGLQEPALQKETFRRAKQGETGIAASTLNLGNELGPALGSVVCGWIAKMAGYPAAFIFCCVPFVYVAFYCIKMIRKQGYGRE